MVPITVCMPVYNREEYIKDCINSILSQTFSDFELLIVDDGSTDETVNIIMSYNDIRIRLIRNNHDYIKSCNMLLQKARGKYIARMDSDDIMIADRLEKQYRFLENNPEVDIVGGSLLVFDEDGDKQILKNVEDVTMRHLYEIGTGISNPTFMLRTEKIRQLGIEYEKEYIYAEDYRFWAQSLRKGLVIKNMPDVLVKYRLSKSQVSSAYLYAQYKASQNIKEQISRWMSEEEELWALSNPITVSESSNSLTIIIPFLNERDEVEKTVRSVRKHVGGLVDIIVINDQSNDGYNYRKKLKKYNVIYIYNVKRKGVAASRDLGIRLCKTPYFLLLDAHMRFYNSNWLEIIINLLKRNDRRILCCQTRFLGKRNNRVYRLNKCPWTYGAKLHFSHSNYIPEIKWNYVESCPDSSLEVVPAILGAGYAASKRYWLKLGGLEGLKYYGNDETFLSLKVGCEGGKCVLLKDVIIGHVYRDKSPYKRYNEEEVYNYLFMAYVLFPQSLLCQSHAISLKKDRNLYLKAFLLFKERKKEIETIKRRIHRNMNISYVKSVAMPQITNETKPLVDNCVNQLNRFGMYLINNVPNDYGIYEGKTSLFIWMCHYILYSKDSSWERYKDVLWEDICDALYKGMLGWNFKHGICGIGWALLYLYSNKIISDFPLDIIKIIDNQLSMFNPSTCEDYSLATGLGGYWAYLTLRIQFGLEKCNFTDYKKDAIRTLKAEGKISSYYYALKYIMLINYGIDKDDMLPCLSDWVSMRLFMPTNPKLWDTSLIDGCVGASIHSMILDLSNKKGGDNDR